MSKAFRLLGITAWIACILLLTFQAITWVVTASWPIITIMDATQKIGLDITTLINTLPFEYAIKGVYFFFTTELSIAFWWIGVLFFVLTFVSKVLFGK